MMLSNSNRLLKLRIFVTYIFAGGVDDDGDENRLSVSWERAGRCQYFEKYVLRGHWDCCSAAAPQAIMARD